MTDVIIAVVCLVFLCVILLLIVNKPFVKQLLVKFRGRTDEIMTRDAETPEGAADYYNAAIREQEEKCKNANDLFIEITGKLDTNERELYTYKKNMMKLDQDINAAVDSNRDNDALILQMKKETIQSKIDSLKQVNEELIQSKDHLEEVRQQALLRLEGLKKRKEETVTELQSSNQIIRLHEAVNSVAATNECDRMLERVEEGVDRIRERAAGSRIAYETSAETQERRAEQAAKEENARKAIEELKRKRSQK